MPFLTRRSAFGAVFVATLAVVANAAVLANRFTLDDRFIILQNARLRLGEFDQFFAQSWWPPGTGTGLYRPLTMTLLGLEWALGGGRPAVFFAVGLVLHALVTLGVLALARQLLSPWPALAVAALFAVHPVHVEAIASGVGQAELLAALLVIVPLAAYIETRRAGPLDGRTGLLVVACGFAALFAKENGIVLPALVVAAEIVLALSPVPARRRWGALGALLAAWGAMAAIWFGTRASILHGFAGEVPLRLYEGRSMLARARMVFGIIPEWSRLLVWPRDLLAEYMTDAVRVPQVLRSGELAGVLIVVAAVTLALVCRRRSPAVVFGIVALPLTLAPVANVLVPTGILLAERTLYLPSAFFLIAVAGIAETVLAVRGRKPWAPAFAAMTLLLVCAGTWRGYRRIRDWRDDDTVFRTLVRDAPDNAHARQLMGAWDFEHGRAADGEREYRYAIALTPWDGQLYEQLGWQYLNRGFCAPAEPLFREALRLGGPRQAATIGLVECLLDRGEAAEATVLVRRALAAGRDPRSLYARLRRAESMQRRSGAR